MITSDIRPATIDVGGLPPAPTTREEAGLSLDLLTQLALKILHFSGELTGESWPSAWA